MLGDPERAKEETELFIDKMPNIYFIVNDKGTILKANVKAAALLNHTMDSVIGHPLAELFDATHWEMLINKFSSQTELSWDKTSFVFPVAKNKSSPNKRQEFYWEIERLDPDGMKAHNMFAVFANDISEQKELQVQLKHIFSLAPLGILSVNRHGTIGPSVSNHMHTLFTDSEIAGKEFLDLIFDPIDHSMPKQTRNIKNKLVEIFGDPKNTTPTNTDREMIVDIDYPVGSIGNDDLRHYRYTFMVVFERDIFQQMLVIIQDQTDLMNEKKSRAQIEAESKIDKLTNIYNRGALESIAFSKIRECRDKFQPISIIFFDIDNFKKYNDTYGHQSGDDCLTKVAAITKNICREHRDYVARYGGEEFVIFMPGADSKTARALAERIRQHVEEAKIKHIGNKPSGVVTVSLGVASENVDSYTDEYLNAIKFTKLPILKNADKAVYTAKKAGRNRIVVYDPSQPETG